MSKMNCTRRGCRDVFHAHLVQNAHFDGDLEIPVILPDSALPNKLISFSKALHTDDHDQWVHFYEDDANFERVWNQPQKYLELLKRFNGMITPDFSLYRDMPLVMQQWNTYRGKALGHWWQTHGLTVLPNIRFSDERSYSFACYGAMKHGTICIGSHGCLRSKSDRYYFELGLREIVSRLEPTVIVVYGAAPEAIFAQYTNQGITILQFDSEYSRSRKVVV